MNKKYKKPCISKPKTSKNRNYFYITHLKVEILSEKESNL